MNQIRHHQQEKILKIQIGPQSAEGDDMAVARQRKLRAEEDAVNGAGGDGGGGNHVVGDAGEDAVAFDHQLWFGNPDDRGDRHLL